MNWACLHPFRTFRGDDHIIEKYLMSLTTETKNGVPHGLCFVEFVRDKDDVGKFDTSFFGFCVMCEGEMHGGPAIFVRLDGKVQRFNMMIHGRSAGDGIIYSEEDLIYYEMRDSLPSLPDQPISLGKGWYFGGFKDAWFTGRGMMGYLSSKYIGEWKKDRKVRGKQIDNVSN
jgi:hypothetical protein